MIESLFPALLIAGYQLTSPATPVYSCIAWAAGDVTEWWWPDPFGDRVNRYLEGGTETVIQTFALDLDLRSRL